jgi:hypothetical protein
MLLTIGCAYLVSLHNDGTSTYLVLVGKRDVLRARDNGLGYGRNANSAGRGGVEYCVSDAGVWGLLSDHYLWRR